MLSCPRWWAPKGRGPWCTAPLAPPVWPPLTHHAKRHYDPTMWVVSANTSLPLSRFFLYLFFLFVTPTGHSGGPILTICASKTSFRARMCLLGFLLISSKNFNCGGVNRSFQAKRVKYSTKFRKIIKNTSTVRGWSPNRRPTSPRWRRAAILKKIVKSPYLRNRLTDFDEIWHDDGNWSPTADLSLKCRIFENPRWWRSPP